MNRLVFALAICIGLSAATAWAFPPSNPYIPPPAEIQGMFDRTGDFSGNTQASTWTPTNIPNGIQVDVNWSTGEAFVNEDFTRAVIVQRFPGDTGDGDGGDLEAFNGVSWEVLSDTDLSFKPYSQPYDTFTFYEGTQDTGGGTGVVNVAANTPTLVQIDWDMVNNGGSIPPAERGNMFEIGFQIFGPSLPQDGTTAMSTVLITNIPEPGTLTLVGLGLALLGSARRRAR